MNTYLLSRRNWYSTKQNWCIDIVFIVILHIVLIPFALIYFASVLARQRLALVGHCVDIALGWVCIDISRFTSRNTRSGVTCGSTSRSTRDAGSWVRMYAMGFLVEHTKIRCKYMYKVREAEQFKNTEYGSIERVSEISRCIFLHVFVHTDLGNGIALYLKTLQYSKKTPWAL